MSTDLGRALHDVTADVAAAARPVDVDRARTRVRRRRTRRVAARCTGALVAVVTVVVAGSQMGFRLSVDLAPAPALPASPDPAATAGPTTCGAAFSLEETDDPEIALVGAVEIGTVDAENRSFTGTSLGDTLLVDVSATSDVPDGPFDGGDRAAVTTVLVDPAGRIAFRTDPARQLSADPGLVGADGELLADGLYDAVDCRTGAPLTGTYRAFATTGVGGDGVEEVVELGPVGFGDGSATWAGSWPDLVPTCGEPAPAELLSGDVDADLTVTLAPGTALDGLPGGLHARATVTSDGGRLVGRVPQALHAVLVDQEGMVVSRVYDPTREEYDSGSTFDVQQGESFSAEVSQWFATCPDRDRYGTVAGGSYDLYLFSVVLAAGEPGSSPSPRIAVGGPYPVTLR